MRFIKIQSLASSLVANNRLPALAVAILVFAHFTAPLRAEYRLSVWGGFFNTEASELQGFSDGTTANLPIRTIFRPKPENGQFWGASFGSALPFSLLGFEQINLYFEGQQTERDEDAITSVGVASIPFANGLAAGLGPAPITAYAERARYEFGVELLDFSSIQELSWLKLDVFAGLGTEEAQSTANFNHANGFHKNESSLDWWFGGILVGAQNSIELGNGFELALQGAIGPYFYSADAELKGSSLNSNSRKTTVDSGYGYRAKARIELQKQLTDVVQLSLFGGVDYWSNVPFNNQQDPSIWNFGRPYSLDTDDTTDWRAGVKLTVKVGN